MKIWKSWVIANKDFSIFLKKKRILYTLIILPLIFSIGIPLFIVRLNNPSDVVDVAGNQILVLNFYSIFYIFLAYIIPTTLASNSIIGEKIEQTLEPLLATPITDSELLLGKTIASFLPCIAMIYLGSIIFMVLTDLITYNKIGYLVLPNWIFGFVLLVGVPISSILSVELNVIISARVNDVRTAAQLGTLLFIPFLGIFTMLMIYIVTFNIINLLIIVGILILADIALFYVNILTFQRDKILTQWN